MISFTYNDDRDGTFQYLNSNGKKNKVVKTGNLA